MKIGLWAVCIILNNFDIFLLNLSLTVNISIKVLPNELVSSMLIVFFNLCLSRITVSFCGAWHFMGGYLSGQRRNCELFSGVRIAEM